MRHFTLALALAIVGASAGVVGSGPEQRTDRAAKGSKDSSSDGRNIQLGPRPFFLVDDMQDGPLKDKLASRTEGPFKRTDFSIGHRGAALQFPEHTRESYEAAARMGAGIVECDVTFTADLELVCRHAQNDLHTTTNILTTPLAAKCTQPFVPATFDAAGNLVSPATAECRTSDITLAEFKTLKGKMDAFDPRAAHRSPIPGAGRPAFAPTSTPAPRAASC